MSILTKVTVCCDGNFDEEKSVACPHQAQVDVTAVDGVPQLPWGWGYATWVKGVLRRPPGHPDYEKQRLLENRADVHSCPECTNVRRVRNKQRPLPPERP